MKRLAVNTVIEVAFAWSIVLFSFAYHGLHEAMDQGIAGVQNHTHFLAFLFSGVLVIALSILIFVRIRQQKPTTKGLHVLRDSVIPEEDEREERLTAAAARTTYIFHTNLLALLLLVFGIYPFQNAFSPMTVLLALAMLFTLERLVFLGIWTRAYLR